MNHPSPGIIRQAAEWAALLATDEATREDRAACEAWCAADALHRQTLERMRAFDADLGDRGDARRRTISVLARSRSPSPRRVGLSALLLLLLPGVGWFAVNSMSVRSLHPDFATTTGQQKAVQLADGSSVTLDTDASIDFRQGSGQRTVSLFNGRILARVAKDRTHPFVVKTRDGTATALGTVFTVRQDADGTRVVVLESRVRVCAARPDTPCLVLHAGDEAWISQAAVPALRKVSVEAAGSWADGLITADNSEVIHILTELNRYRSKPILFDASDLGGIRVSGTFPVTDTDGTLTVLAEYAKLHIERDGQGHPVTVRRK